MSYDQSTWDKTWYSTANEKDRKLFKEWLHNVIRTEKVTLTFTKVDGTQRTMLCSLNPDLIPADKLQKEEVKPRKRSEEALVVWDIDKQDWRSFRYDSVREFGFTLGE